MPSPPTLLADPTLAFLAPAFAPAWVAPRLEQALGRSLSLHDIRLLRHKPGRRCLIAYDLELAGEAGPMTVVGKVRSRGLDHRSYELQSKLWHYGFDDASPDGVSVPEPLGVLTLVRHIYISTLHPNRRAAPLLTLCEARLAQGP